MPGTPTGKYITVIDALNQVGQIIERLHPADVKNLERFIGTTRASRLHLTVEPETVGGPSTWVDEWERQRAAEDLAEMRSG